MFLRQEVGTALAVEAGRPCHAAVGRATMIGTTVGGMGLLAAAATRGGARLTRLPGPGPGHDLHMSRGGAGGMTGLIRRSNVKEICRIGLGGCFRKTDEFGIFGIGIEYRGSGVGGVRSSYLYYTEK